jgi:hypothetical protein
MPVVQLVLMLVNTLVQNSKTQNNYKINNNLLSKKKKLIDYYDYY